MKNLREGKIAVRSIAHNPPIRTSRDPIPVAVNVEFWFIIPIRKTTPADIMNKKALGSTLSYAMKKNPRARSGATR